MGNVEVFERWVHLVEIPGAWKKKITKLALYKSGQETKLSDIYKWINWETKQDNKVIS